MSMKISMERGDDDHRVRGGASSPVTLTEAAADELRRIVADVPGKPAGIKIHALTQGCKGTSFTLEILEHPGPGDECFEQHGLRIWLDARQNLFLVGVQLDFVDRLQTRGFVFNRPA